MGTPISAAAPQNHGVTRHGEERVEVLLRMLRETLADERRTDRKAQVLASAIALFVALISVAPREVTLVGALESQSILLVLLVLIYIGILVAVCASTLATIIALRSRHAAFQARSLYGYRFIAERSAAQFEQAFAATTPEERAVLVLEQIRSGGLVVAYKRRWLRYAVRLFFVAAALYLANFVLAFIVFA